MLSQVFDAKFFMRNKTKKSNCCLEFQIPLSSALSQKSPWTQCVRTFNVVVLSIFSIAILLISFSIQVFQLFYCVNKRRKKNSTQNLHDFSTLKICRPQYFLCVFYIHRAFHTKFNFSNVCRLSIILITLCSSRTRRMYSAER